MLRSTLTQLATATFTSCTRIIISYKLQHDAENVARATREIPAVLHARRYFSSHGKMVKREALCAGTKPVSARGVHPLFEKKLNQFVKRKKAPTSASSTENERERRSGRTLFSVSFCPSILIPPAPARAHTQRRAWEQSSLLTAKFFSPAAAAGHFWVSIKGFLLAYADRGPRSACPFFNFFFCSPRFNEVIYLWIFFCSRSSLLSFSTEFEGARRGLN